jgi:hypothetical protein
MYLLLAGLYVGAFAIECAALHLYFRRQRRHERHHLRVASTKEPAVR